jgi:GNAT superfamily N-acetyltransferase
MTGTITIRLLADAPHAAAAVAAWLFDEWGHRYPGRTPAMAVALFRQRANTDRLPIAWVALDGDRPVATASLVETETPADEPGPWVASVYVAASHRGQGLARRLMAVVEAAAPSLGAHRLLLSAAAPALYLSLGYAPTGATKNGEPVMEKHLAP